MSYASYLEINSLEEFSFIAGDKVTLAFTVFDDDGVTPMDLGGASVYLPFAPFGQPEYSELKVTGSVTGINTFEFVLDGLTNDMSGKYIYQPTIVSFGGTEYRPAQGLVTIGSRIPYV